MAGICWILSRPRDSFQKVEVVIISGKWSLSISSPSNLRLHHPAISFTIVNFRQLVSAVEYLHSMDIAHRDLKCENVLLTGRDQIKISDFGFARYCHNDDGKRILSDTYCGSAAYAAPEILQVHLSRFILDTLHNVHNV